MLGSVDSWVFLTPFYNTQPWNPRMNAGKIWNIEFLWELSHKSYHFQRVLQLVRFVELLLEWKTFQFSFQLEFAWLLSPGYHCKWPLKPHDPWHIEQSWPRRKYTTEWSWYRVKLIYCFQILYLCKRKGFTLLVLVYEIQWF